MTKEIPMHKLQAPKSHILGLGAWNLEFGAFLVFGFWRLNP
jgi:hypothetical protein